MGYLFQMLAVTVLPILFGFRVGVHRRARIGLSKWTAVLLCATVVGLWFWLSSGLRDYADSDASGWQLAEMWTQKGRWYVYATAVLSGLGLAAGREWHGHRISKQILYGLAVLLVVLVTVWRTFPVYVILPPGQSQRDDFGYMRQSVQFTCAPVALANLLEKYYLHDTVTERQIAKLAGTTYEGTTTTGLMRAAEKLGYSVESCRMMTFDELLAWDGPAIVKISTCPGVRHATLIIGTNDKMIYFSDPSYGLRKMTHETFVRVWYGSTLILADCPPLANQNGTQ